MSNFNMEKYLYVPLLVEYKNELHFPDLKMIYDQASYHQTQRVQTNFLTLHQSEKLLKANDASFSVGECLLDESFEKYYFKR